MGGQTSLKVSITKIVSLITILSIFKSYPLSLNADLFFLLQEIVHYESYGSKVFCFRRTKKKQKVDKATSSPNIQSKQIALS